MPTPASILTRLAVLLLLGVAPSSASEINPANLSFDSDVKPVLAKLCYDCHGDAKQKGGVNLQKYGDVKAIQRGALQWDDVLRMVRDREMPPEKAKTQPSDAERTLLTGWVSHALDTIDPADMPRDPGQVVLHRLTRNEYNNTIRDLLGVDTHPADKFPVDAGGGGGFDNNADTLFIAPLLFEKLMTAASDILDDAKPERLFTAKPAEDKPKARREAAKTIVAAFAKRAFRRPIPPAESERLLKVFDACEKKNINFEDSVKLTLKSILVSPNFLYRVEDLKPSTQPYEIGHYEMAVRLSYFLWSSMPDDELFTLAENRKLGDPTVIEQQVARMLKDPKARELGESFAAQWLQTDNLKTGGGPDAGYFPGYTDALRDSMCAEPVAFFNGLVARNRSVLDLLDSDYVYVDERLARHYGISGVSGNEFREVKHNDPNRGGVLTMASVLTLTSHSRRTSPVLRGKWVLEKILNAKPPPPPPNVPALPDDNKEEAKKDQTLRERLEKHRADPTCATCHNRIDPLGFGLQNFDLVGVFRAKDERGQAIDAAGALTTGEKFSGPVELKKLLMSRKDAFARAITEKLLSYALGRGLEFYDRPVVTELTTALIKDGYRVQTLITGVAKSFPFRFKRNQPVQEASK
jgi:hypothetical protein